jgi:hypothetical protein
MANKKDELFKAIMDEIGYIHWLPKWDKDTLKKAFARVDGMMVSFFIVFDDEESQEFILSWKKEMERERKELGL